MSLIDYVRTLARLWPLILLLALQGGLLGFAVARSETPMYRASSSTLLTTEAVESTSELVQGSAYVSNLVDSYVQVATSELVLAPVVEELGLSVAPHTLANSISVSNPLNTLVIDISVTHAEPEEAHRIATAVTEQFADATEIVSPSTADGPAVRMTVLTSPRVPSVPVSPNTRLYILAGVMLGAAAGVGYALLRRLMGTSVTSDEDVETVTDLPVLGKIVEAKGTVPQAVLNRPLGTEAESLRALAANLRFLSVDKELRSLIVTSGNPREGKSSVATGLALAMAESSERVLLVDGDLRAPTISQLTNLSNAIGLSDVLVASVTLEEAVQQWGMPGLDVLTSGTIPPNPAQLMGSQAMHTLLEQAVTVYDHVVIDTPPVLMTTDALWLSLHSDGVLVVARRGRTSTRALGKVLAALDSAPVLGVAISRVTRGKRQSYGPQPRARRRGARQEPRP